MEAGTVLTMVVLFSIADASLIVNASPDILITLTESPYSKLVLALLTCIGALGAWPVIKSCFQHWFLYNSSNNNGQKEDNDETLKTSPFNVPYLENLYFTGRRSQLDDMRRFLTGSGVSILAITGQGGMGKTQLALKYVYTYLYKNEFDLIWWFRAIEEASLRDDYLALGTHLKLSNIGKPDDVISAVRNYLETHPHWLLIFDNVPDSNVINAYLPRKGVGQIIITSLNPNWGHMAELMSLEEFTPKEAVTFLLQRTKLRDKKGAGELAQELGYLPLALEQAGAYIVAMDKMPFSEYIRLFKQNSRDVLGQMKPHDYTDTVATTWNLSVKAVWRSDPSAVDLLRLCSFLAPESIPRWFPIRGASTLPEPLASGVKDEARLNAMLMALRRYSLIRITKDAFSIHRLLQTVTRNVMNSDDRKAWSEFAVKAVKEAFPYHLDDTGSDSHDKIVLHESYQLLPHALAAAKYAEEEKIVPEVTSYLMSYTAFYLRRQADFNAARDILERALKIEEGVYGKEHPEVARTLGNLGVVLIDIGDLQGACGYLERILNIQEKVYGNEHPEVAITLSNIGSVLRDLGDLQGGRDYLERAITIKKNVYGKDHPEVALTLTSLGIVLRDLGELQRAHDCLERALNILENVYGKDHPVVATTLTNLGLVLCDLGDLQEAKEFQKRALNIKENVYGKDHPQVAMILGNLGHVLHDMGDLEEAKKCLERALKIFLETLGPDHPKTKATQNLLDKFGR